MEHGNIDTLCMHQLSGSYDRLRKNRNQHYDSASINLPLPPIGSWFPMGMHPGSCLYAAPWTERRWPATTWQSRPQMAPSSPPPPSTSTYSTPTVGSSTFILAFFLVIYFVREAYVSPQRITTSCSLCCCMSLRRLAPLNN